MRRNALTLAALLLVASAVGMTAQNRQSAVEVYKDPACGCCSKWIEHLQGHGFTAKAIETDKDKLDALKSSRGIPQKARSCHTAIVGGYVVEGHVPAADVQRLLKERPAIVGIAVPGMPIGSPGMEVPGMKAQSFDVIAFSKDGSTRVFASH